MLRTSLLTGFLVGLVIGFCLPRASRWQSPESVGYTWIDEAGEPHREYRPALLTLSCPECGTQIKGIDLNQGNTWFCPHCGLDLTIPQP